MGRNVSFFRAYTPGGSAHFLTSQNQGISPILHLPFDHHIDLVHVKTNVHLLRHINTSTTVEKTYLGADMKYYQIPIMWLQGF